MSDEHLKHPKEFFVRGTPNGQSGEDAAYAYFGPPAFNDKRSQILVVEKEVLGLARDMHHSLVGTYEAINHAKGTAEKSYVSLIYGHTHVYQSYTHKK